MTDDECTAPNLRLAVPNAQIDSTVERVGRRFAWVAPAATGAAVTVYLAWGAWVSAADPAWLHASAAWWRAALQPGALRVPLVFAALWLLALISYWWPRRLQPRVVGITTVVTMVVIGGVLTTSSLFPCRAGQTPGAVAGWVLDLYVGNPPSFPVGACHLPSALAYQLGGPVCLGATLVGAVTAAAVVWRQPVDRMRARIVRDATIFTGLDAMTMPLLQRLAQTFRPASIVVIEPDASHPLLDQARATGAHVMIGQPSSPRVLLPVIAGRPRQATAGGFTPSAGHRAGEFRGVRGASRRSIAGTESRQNSLQASPKVL